MRPLLFGGAVVATGGYGCVFTYMHKNLGDCVGKVNFIEPMWMENEDASPEKFRAIQNKIFSLDPKENYFITVRDIVKFSSTHEDISKCVALYNEKWKGRNIKFKKGQILDAYIQRRVDSAPPISEWTPEQKQHAFNGMQLLHMNNLCHNDISLQNFGFRNGLPVYIDMDGAWEDKKINLSSRRNGRITLSTFGSRYDDVDAVKQVFNGDR